MFGCIESVRDNDPLVVKPDDQILGAGFTECAVLVFAISPGSLAVFNAHPPGRAEHGSDFLLRSLADFNGGYLGGRKIMPHREAA